MRVPLQNLDSLPFLVPDSYVGIFRGSVNQTFATPEHLSDSFLVGSDDDLAVRGRPTPNPHSPILRGRREQGALRVEVEGLPSQAGDPLGVTFEGEA